MFLLERIFGLSIFLVSLLITIYLICKVKSYKQVRKVLLIYLIILAIMGYLFIPYKTNDLYRLFITLEDYYFNMSFSEFIDGLSNTLLYSEYSYFYLISRFKLLHLLPAITAILYYGIVFYIILDYSKKSKISNTAIAKTLFYFMICGQYIAVIAGIRTQLAFVLIFLCFYREFFNNKSFLLNLPLYLIAIGMHLAIVPIIFVRIIMLLFQKEKTLLNKVINYFLFLLSIFLILKYGGNIIENTFFKAENYLSKNVYSNFWEYIKTGINLILNIFLLYIFKKIKSKNVKDLNINKYISIIIVLIIINWLFSFEFSIFARYATFINLLLIPVLLQLNNLKENKILKMNYKYKIKIFTKYDLIYYILLFSMSVITFTRGDLTALKFFELG